MLVNTLAPAVFESIVVEFSDHFLSSYEVSVIDRVFVYFRVKFLIGKLFEYISSLDMQKGRVDLYLKKMHICQCLLLYLS